MASKHLPGIGFPVAKPTKPIPSSAPVYGKPIENKWLSPDLRDRMIIVLKDSRAPDYKVPEQGEKFQGLDISGKLTETFQFASVLPTDTVGDVHWVYLAPFQDQDTYNYKVTYPYVDVAFPMLTREYVVLRTDTVIADEPNAGTTDVQFTSYILTDHQIERLPEPLDSLFVKVTRIFEVIPGKAFVTSEIAEDGALIDVIKTKKLDSAITITPETIVGGSIWIRTNKEPINTFVAWEVVKARLIPGTPIVAIKVDGEEELNAITDTIQEAATIPVINSTEASGVITETEKVPISGSALVAKKQVTQRFWLNKKKYTISIPEGIIPEEFRAKIPTHVDSQIIAGTAVRPTALGFAQFELSREQLTRLLYEERITLLDVEPPVILTGDTKSTAEKQVLEITLGLVADTTDPLPTTAVRDVTYTKLGNGMATERIEVTTNPGTGDPEVFPRVKYTKEIPDLLPDILRARIPSVTTEITEEGNATVPPDPAGGILSASDEGVTDLTHRTVRTSRTITGASLTYTTTETTEEYGGGVLIVNHTLAPVATGLTVDTGFKVTTSFVHNLGNGYDYKETKILGADEWGTTLDNTFDEEMQNRVIEEKQVVPIDYVPTSGLNFVENLKAIDIWRSQRIKITRSPTAVSEATAVITYAFSPYQFPGTLSVFEAVQSNCWLGHRQTRADLVRQKIKTWWVNGAIPDYPEGAGLPGDGTFAKIIMDTITIASNTRIREYPDVLHDAWTTVIGIAVDYAATTPSYTEYYLGTDSGSTTPHNLIVLNAPGTGYTIGDLIYITSDTGPSARVSVSELGVANSILNFNVIFEGLGGTFTNPVAASGGSGTDASFDVIPYTTPIYVPGTAWVGTERVIAVNITRTEIPDQWKIQTKTIVMR